MKSIYGKGHSLGDTIMEQIRSACAFCRTVALATTLLLLNAVIWPSWAIAVEVDRHKEQQEQARWEARHQTFEQVLRGIRDQAREQQQTMREQLGDDTGIMTRAARALGLGDDALATDRLSWLQTQANTMHQQALEGFKQTGVRLQQSNASSRMLDRHERAVEDYRQRYQSLKEQLQSVTASTSLANQRDATEELLSFLQQFRMEKPRDPFNPDKLPWRTPDPDQTPAPADSASQLSRQTGLPLFDVGPQVASSSASMDGLLLESAVAPGDEHLASTLDATINPAIEALAEQLDHDPVAIYQWVRNNIEFIPSYGSIQGAGYTLENRRGNAFDTASLLIALLRTSGIPARYAMGTVEMPADQVMNWVGDVRAPGAAGNLLGQGGIPNSALTRGGRVDSFRLEHVWVEAWVDFHPSRGADHRQGDTWIPMDASFKQYDYGDGMELGEAVPFDAQALADTIEQQSTINEEEGWVQGVPGGAIEDSLEDYRAELEAYIDSQAPEATVGEVLGSKVIKEVIHQQLAPSLPYRLITRQLTTAELPDSLRWKFKYQLHTDANGYKGTELLTIEEPTVALAGQKMSLSFTPATQEDEDTLASYLPEADENGELDPGDLPDTLPGYLINLKAEFAIGENIVANPDIEVTMGSGLISEMGYWQPNRGWDTSDNNPIAGEYRALALDLQGISATAAENLENDLEATQAKLEAEDYSGLTKQKLVGDMLYSTILGYFALNDMQDRIGERQAHSVGYRVPSYGLFKTSLQPQYWFGMPRNVRASGLTMDVDHMSSIRVDKDNNRERWVAYNRATGARMSAMEHLVPEEMYSTEDNPAHGISAVKALQLAAAEGQKIWTITQSNLTQAMAALNLSSSVEADIRNAVRTGKEVTAHEDTINFHGRHSAGYIVLDPETGAGGYLIASGENGGDLLVDLIDMLATIIGALDHIGVVGDALRAIGKYLGGGAGIVGFVLGLISLFDRCMGVNGFVATVILYSVVQIALAALVMFLAFSLIGILIGVLISVYTNLIVNAAIESLCGARRNRNEY